MNSALERAGHYGVETERGLWLYANLAVTLGTSFDVDPSLPWAGETLRDPAYLGDERVDDLWNTQVDWCEETIGEGEYWPQAVIDRLRQLAPPVGYGALAAYQDLEQLWPEKVFMAEERGCRAFIDAVMQRARYLGLGDEHAIRRYMRVAFVLGFAFDADPMHDWSWPIWQRIGTVDDASVMDMIMQELAGVATPPANEPETT